MKIISYSLTLSLIILFASPAFSQKTEKFKQKLWVKYKKEMLENQIRKTEHEKKSIAFNGKTMRYDYQKKGEIPKNGYPLYIALHGGGGAPPSVNDSQWEHMKVFYAKSVETGIYLAPRGVSDTWNLHFVDETFPMLDRLIENMIVFENVNPNQIYLTGYSAGGDGVYQLTPRMADRFAAANMSAGHPNGIDLTNLYHVPFAIQMGELDGSYDRNKEAAKYGQKLADLQKAHPKGYKHDVFIHWEKEHSYVKDHSGKNATSEIIVNPNDWLVNENTKKKENKNTDAIHWMSQNIRTPLPSHLIWNYEVRANSRNGLAKDKTSLWSTTHRSQLFYWLDAGTTEQGKANKIIDVEIDKSQNLIQINSMGAYLKILINSQMLDLSKEIIIQVGGITQKIKKKPSKKIMKQTLWDRGDKNFIFENSIEIEMNDKGLVIR